MADDPILEGQIQYYRDRANEYHEWFLRRGRYDYGEEHNREWFAEVEHVERALAAAQPHGHVLELACGEGTWTERLAKTARRITAVDASPEMIALNERRLAGSNVEYVVADIFSWHAPEAYDFVFFGFWLSHVPPDRFDPFWQRVAGWLRPGGTVFFVDSLPDPTSTASDQPLPERGDPVMTRRLNDGREYQIYKVFYDPAALETRLEALGWRAHVQTSGWYFLYGRAGR